MEATNPDTAADTIESADGSEAIVSQDASGGMDSTTWADAMDVTSAVAAVSSKKKGVQPYDLRHEDRVVRSPLPGLDLIDGRFLRLVEPALFQLARQPMGVSSSRHQMQRYEAFLNNIPVPASFHLTSVQPLRGSALVVCEPDLVFMVIDALFGGTGKLPSQLDGRVFSVTEQRVIRRLFDAIAGALSQAWNEVFPLRFEHQQAEMSPKDLALAQPRETVVVTRYEVTLGERMAAFHVCLPYATVEPIREVLVTPPPSPANGTDTRWTTLLSQQIQAADVTLVAELGSASTTIEQLLALQTGDFIELELDADLTASIEGLPMMSCRYGTANGRYALKVNRLLTPTPAPQPGAHA